MKSGYWQVDLYPEDNEKTVLSTGQGLRQFTVTPFGLCNAPATFELLMQTVSKSLIYESCLVYVDDVIVIARTLEEHLSNLGKVLQGFQGSRLKLNPEKRQIFQEEVWYFRHILSLGGITTKPEKLNAVWEWPTPKNKHEIRNILGTCS
jgi:hypothetical protein